MEMGGEDKLPDTARTGMGSEGGQTLASAVDSSGTESAAVNLTRAHDAEVIRQRELQKLRADSLYGRMEQAISSDSSHVMLAEKNQYVRVRRVKSAAVPLKHEDVLKVSAGITSIDSL